MTDPFVNLKLIASGEMSAYRGRMNNAIAKLEQIPSATAELKDAIASKAWLEQYSYTSIIFGPALTSSQWQSEPNKTPKALFRLLCDPAIQATVFERYPKLAKGQLKKAIGEENITYTPETVRTKRGSKRSREQTATVSQRVSASMTTSRSSSIIERESKTESQTVARQTSNIVTTFHPDGTAVSTEQKEIVSTTLAVLTAQEKELKVVEEETVAFEQEVKTTVDMLESSAANRLSLINPRLVAAKEQMDRHVDHKLRALFPEKAVDEKKLLTMQNCFADYNSQEFTATMGMIFKSETFEERQRMMDPDALFSDADADMVNFRLAIFAPFTWYELKKMALPSCISISDEDHVVIQMYKLMEMHGKGARSNLLEERKEKWYPTYLGMVNKPDLKTGSLVSYVTYRFDFATHDSVKQYTQVRLSATTYGEMLSVSQSFRDRDHAIAVRKAIDKGLDPPKRVIMLLGKAEAERVYQTYVDDLEPAIEREKKAMADLETRIADKTNVDDLNRLLARSRAHQATINDHEEMLEIQRQAVWSALDVKAHDKVFMPMTYIVDNRTFTTCLSMRYGMGPGDDGDYTFNYPLLALERDGVPLIKSFMKTHSAALLDQRIKSAKKSFDKRRMIEDLNTRAKRKNMEVPSLKADRKHIEHAICECLFE